MKAGVLFIFQNHSKTVSDKEVWDDQLRLSELAEPLGFDSVWATEHHFSNYEVTPDPTQYLTWVAARSEQIELGTEVIVLPWHQPIRAIEEVALLDVISNGRLILGMGRGAARRECEGFQVPMSESRQRFLETADLFVRSLKSGWVEYDGETIKQPRTELRPRPFKSFEGRTYCAAISPETYDIIAGLGLGLLINPQKPWPQILQDLETYRGAYQRANGTAAPPPILTSFTYVHHDADHAEEMVRKYMGFYYGTAMEHYELAGSHFRDIKGYEFYGNIADALTRAGDDGGAAFYCSLQPWGTPDQAIEKILELQKKTDAQHISFVFAYGGMPTADVEASMRLFAQEVLPAIKAGAVAVG